MAGTLTALTVALTAVAARTARTVASTQARSRGQDPTRAVTRTARTRDRLTVPEHHSGHVPTRGLSSTQPEPWPWSEPEG